MKLLSRALTLSLLLALAGCASTYTMAENLYKDGEISSTVSEFDGSKETRVEVAYLRERRLRLGAYRTTKDEKNMVIVAEVLGAQSIGSKAALQFNLDGTVYKFDSLDVVTHIQRGSLSSRNSQEIHNYSSKRFLVPEKFISSLLKAKRAVVRLEMTTGAAEDIFEDPSAETQLMTGAATAFKNFSRQLETAP